jgi:hypothetical protein
MTFGREAMPSKMTSMSYSLIPHFQPFKMVDVRTSEMDAKLAPVNVGPRNSER